MKVKIDIKDKRLLTMKEFCAYTSFGPSTASSLRLHISCAARLGIAGW